MHMGDPCAGPNHGNAQALPRGRRQWTMGHLLTLTQEVTGQPGSHLVFCSPECMCDWHGQHAAFSIDNQQNEEFGIPGSFRLIWCSPVSSTVGFYADWDELTAHIGQYQQRLLKFQDQAEARASQETFQPPFDA